MAKPTQPTKPFTASRERFFSQRGGGLQGGTTKAARAPGAIRQPSCAKPRTIIPPPGWPGAIYAQATISRWHNRYGVFTAGLCRKACGTCTPSTTPPDSLSWCARTECAAPLVRGTNTRKTQITFNRMQKKNKTAATERGWRTPRPTVLGCATQTRILN